ncbi:MAG: hypothetical protein H0Z37_05715 [Firmicutes bacterium]|nr:hypothetical protein [Bacillota bacterium]
MSRKKYCPACGSRMEGTRTTHRTVNAEGRPVLYYNVWRFECPQGCATTTYDYSQASLDPEGRMRGFRWAVEAGPSGAAAAAPSFLERLDLSFLITVVGLILGYLMFAWCLIIIPASPVGKIVCAALLTAGALYVLVHLTAAPPASDESGAGEPEEALAASEGEGDSEEQEDEGNRAE